MCYDSRGPPFRAIFVPFGVLQLTKSSPCIPRSFIEKKHTTNGILYLTQGLLCVDGSHGDHARPPRRGDYKHHANKKKV